jgi:uncharacterized protein RhaS with RHS repeats
VNLSAVSQDGEWLSRDPLKDVEVNQGPNIYKYEANDPITFVDPDGLDIVTYDVAGGFVTNSPTGWAGEVHSLSHKTFGTAGPTLIVFKVCHPDHQYLVGATTKGGGMPYDPARGGWTLHPNQPAENDVTVDIQTTTLVHEGWTDKTMDKIRAIVVTVSCSSDPPCKKK